MTPTLEQLLATVVREHYPHPPATEAEIAAFEPLPNARYSLLSLGELQRARVRMRGIDDVS